MKNSGTKPRVEPFFLLLSGLCLVAAAALVVATGAFSEAPPQTAAVTDAPAAVPSRTAVPAGPATEASHIRSESAPMGFLGSPGAWWGL